MENAHSQKAMSKNAAEKRCFLLLLADAQQEAADRQEVKATDKALTCRLLVWLVSRSVYYVNAVTPTSNTPALPCPASLLLTSQHNIHGGFLSSNNAI